MYGIFVYSKTWVFHSYVSNFVVKQNSSGHWKKRSFTISVHSRYLHAEERNEYYLGVNYPPLALNEEEKKREKTR